MAHKVSWHVRSGVQPKRVDAVRLHVQSEIDRHSAICPCCGFGRLEARTEADRAHRTLQPPKQVLYVGVAYRFVVKVPVRLCGACGSSFSCCPIDVDCLPASPIEAWDVARCKDHIPIWFSIELVKFFEEGTNLIRRFSIYKAAEWLDRTHVDNGCSTVVPFDKLRKGLGAAVREWGYLVCRMSDMSAMGVSDWPTGNLLGFDVVAIHVQVQVHSFKRLIIAHIFRNSNKKNYRFVSTMLHEVFLIELALCARRSA